MGRDGAKLVVRHLERQVHVARVADIDDLGGGRSPSQALRRVRQRGVAAGRSRVTPRVLRAVRLVVVRAHQEARHLLDGPLGGGEADAGNRPVGKRA